MNNSKKYINRIILLASGFLMLLVGVSSFIYLQLNENQNLGCGTKTQEFVCGNTPTNLSDNAQKGKEIFNSNCAACHKLYANMNGPALSKIDSTKLWNWITEKNGKADSTKFSRMKIDYHKIMWNESLNETQLNELYEYMKSEK